jgi:hypothetical protein
MWRKRTFPPQPQPDPARRIQAQIELGGASGAEPEEFSVGVSRLMRVQIPCIQKLELLTAPWIDTVSDHWNAPRKLNVVEFKGENL